MDRQYDKILIKNLVLKNVAGVEAWQRVKSQPVVISAALYTDVSDAGITDHVTNTIHYGHVTKAITKLGETTTFASLESFAHAIVRLCCVKFGAAKTEVTVEQPKALLHASASGVKMTRALEDFASVDEATETKGDVSGLGVFDEVFVKDLRLHAIVGVNPWEREEKQVMIFNLTLYPSSLPYGDTPKSYHLRTIVRYLTRHIEASGYKTIEALGITLARLALEKCHVNKISVRIEKPSAILFADCSGIEVTRDRVWLKQLIEKEEEAGMKYMSLIKSSKDIPADYTETVYIGFGSNVGDRVKNILMAMDRLESECSSVIVDTSFLYETPPMYYTDQPAFLNGVCKVLTCLKPLELLAKLKHTEHTLGRLPNFRNGPRLIDLDILFYNDLVMDEDTLIIPHKSIQEREFVLWPLCDIARDMEHPRLFKTNGQLLSQLLKLTADSAEGPLQINKVIPIHQEQLWRWNAKTYVMGILNVTPDSFSDGGIHNGLEQAIEAAYRMKEEGADIIDIGGMSTRPGANDSFPEKEEIARVVPVITQLRARGFDLPISIDTFRASVALAAIRAGANMINDISGGNRDPQMLKVMAETKVPVCLMHMRGDAQTMMSKENTHYDNDDVVYDVSHVLHQSVQRAIAAGVHRWNIIVDPGVGFAKTAEQDFELLRHLKDISNGSDSPLRGYPSLMGISRKKFIGKVTGVNEADKRAFGTAGAVAACVAGGVNIMRVHDVRPMWEVIQVCDTVWNKKL